MSTTQLKPGRDLDALIEEKVFGNQVFRNPKGGWSVGAPQYYDDHGFSELLNPLPNYSEEIAAAWLVVEALSTDWLFELVTRTDGTVMTKFIRRDGTRGIKREAETAPLAICLAALKAVGVKV